MNAAEIVDRAEQINAVREGGLSARQAMCAADQRGEIGAEGPIQPFDEGGVYCARNLGVLAEVDEHDTRATQDGGHNMKAALDVMLDDLSQGQTRPDPARWATESAFLLIRERAQRRLDSLPSHRR